jgi:hypothetical protein
LWLNIPCLLAPRRLCAAPQINGAVTSEFDECGVASGYMDLEAEGSRVEHRNAKIKTIE